MALFYLRPVNGLDTNDGLSFANAFKTFQKAADNCGSGDTVRCCPEAVETVATAIDIDVGGGLQHFPPVFEPGNTTDGSLDLSLTYTLQASASISAIIIYSSDARWRKFYNIIFDGNSNATNCFYSADVGSYKNRYINCRITGATGDGFKCHGSQVPSHSFFDCEIDGNGGIGVTTHSAGNGACELHGGSVHDNTSDGIYLGDSGSIVDGVLVYGNGGDGIAFGVITAATINNNTVYDNSGDGVKFYSTTAMYGISVYNNSCVGNGGYGFNHQHSNQSIFHFMDYNHTHGNTSGASDYTLVGENNITGDPLFLSLTDLTPAPASPLIAAGLQGRTIGAKEKTNQYTMPSIASYPEVHGVTAASSTSISVAADVRIADPFDPSNLTLVEFVASTSNNWSGFNIACSPNANLAICSVFVGGSGSEVRIASVPATTAYRGLGFEMYVPIPISAGSRITVGVSSADTGSTYVQLIGIPSNNFENEPNFTVMDCGPFNLENASGTYGHSPEVDPGATINTKGSYSEHSWTTGNGGNNVINGDSIPHRYAYLGVITGGLYNLAMGNSHRLHDIAHGAASSEVIFLADYWDRTQSTDLNRSKSVLWLPWGRSAGDRISSRMQCSLNDAEDRLGGFYMFGLR